MAALSQFSEYVDPTQIEQHFGVIMMHLADNSQTEEVLIDIQIPSSIEQ